MRSHRSDIDISPAGGNTDANPESVKSRRVIGGRMIVSGLITPGRDTQGRPVESARHVWILHYTCAPIIGGVESVMSEHARVISSHGHSVNLIAGRGAPQIMIPEINSLHPSVLAAQNDLASGLVTPEFELLRARIRGVLAAKLSAIDAPVAPVVFAHNVFTLHKNLALTAALADLAREGRAQFVAWCHDLAWTNPLYLSALHEGLPWDLLRTPCPGVEYVTISDTRRLELADLFGWPPERIRCVPNGLDATRFLSASQQMRLLLRRIDWWERDVVLLAPVRMTQRKNLELAIGVAAALKAAGRRPLLLITGPPGPHNPRHDYAAFLWDVRQRLGLEDEVRFLSKGSWLLNGVSDELMGELYRWADALIFPSLQEGFGLPLLEAGLARLPVFCSDLPVLREIGGEDVHYFAPDASPDSVACQVQTVLAAPGVAALRRRVLREYRWEEIYREGLQPFLSQEGGAVHDKCSTVA